MLAKPSEQVLPILQYVGEPLLSKLCHVFWRFRFGLAALLIPFTIRIIPELIAGPYPIGYDTIGSYVPFMLDWSTGNFKSFNPFIGGWILYAVLGITYTYTHIDPVAITKLTAPLLYSGLVFSEYCFARRTLGWDEKKSGFLIVVSSLYFASLRVSWDLFRNTLGLVMLFPALILNQELLTKRRAVLLAAISWLIVATHLLVGTLLLGISLLGFLQTKEGRIPRVLAMLPGAAEFVSSLVGFQFKGTSIISFGASTIEPLSSYAFAGFVLLPLFPMALFGFARTANAAIRSWCLTCLVGIVLGTTPLATNPGLITPDRWALMLSVPMIIIAVEGYSRLHFKPLRKWFPISGFLKLSWLCLVALLGITFMALPAADAFPYFVSFATTSPTSMLQSTVPLEDSQSLVTAISWLSSNARPGAVIMADHVMGGWLREYYKGTNPVVGYGPELTLQQDLTLTLSKGYQIVYTLWWIDHFGLYGEPTVPSGFEVTHIEGRIGVFVYAT